MINYDTHRLVQVTKDRASSVLTLVNASDSDSGNYTCSPYNVRPDSVSVHVLKETEGPAATVHKDGGTGGGGGGKPKGSNNNAALPVQSSSLKPNANYWTKFSSTTIVAYFLLLGQAGY